MQLSTFFTFFTGRQLLKSLICVSTDVLVKLVPIAIVGGKLRAIPAVNPEFWRGSAPAAP